MINKERLIADFCDLVSIDSPSFNERAMANKLKKCLLDLNFYVYEDDAGSKLNGTCGNIYGFLKGDIEGDPILLSAHMDTVEPSTKKVAIRHEDGRITSDGKTVLGADDISGIVAILEAIRSVNEHRTPHRSIEVLFTIAEEAYLRGSEAFDYSIIKSKEAYVLDLSGEIGLAALAAPTLISFSANVKGKASHAGFAPEEGIHAIKIAAEAIVKIAQGRVGPDLTVNIGKIEGGLGTNIVPDNCTIKGEVRSLDHNKALTEAEKIKNILDTVAAKNNTTCQFTSSFGSIAYDTPKEARVVTRFESCCKELGIQTNFTKTFGGSDNNNFALHNISGIVMACGMNQVHSTKEYTHASDLEKCCKIVFKLITSKE